MSSTQQDGRKQDLSERDLCPHCMTANAPDAHFCFNCGTPLTSHAATDPLRRIFALGYVVSKRASRPRNLTVLIGMWLIFGSTFLYNLGNLWVSFAVMISRQDRFHDISPAPGYSGFFPELLTFLMTLGLEVLFGAILVKVTLNYWRGVNN